MMTFTCNPGPRIMSPHCVTDVTILDVETEMFALQYPAIFIISKYHTFK